MKAVKIILLLCSFFQIIMYAAENNVTPLNAVVTFEINDHNFAISNRILDAFESQSVVICSGIFFNRFVNKYVDFLKKQKRDQEAARAQNVINNMLSGKWKVFSKSYYYGQIEKADWVVIVPLEKYETLRAYFDTKVLKEVFDSTIFTVGKFADSQAYVSSLKKLFTRGLKNIPKRFILTGHGSEFTIASIPTYDMFRLIEILQKINTQFLYITGCYGGGMNLVNIQDGIKDHLKSKFTDYLNKEYSGNESGKRPETIQFPIVVQATTDAPTYGVGDTARFFNLLDAFLKQPQWYLGKVSDKADKISINDVLAAYYPGNISAIPNIRFPGTNSFFRTAQVEDMDILTWVYVQGLRFSPKFLRLSETQAVLVENQKRDNRKYHELERIYPKTEEIKKEMEVIWDRIMSRVPLMSQFINFAEVKLQKSLALVYPCDLTEIPFKTATEAFISKIPGKAQHYFGEILLTKKAPLQAFIPEISDAYGSSAKAWFFKELNITGNVSSSARWFLNPTGIIIYKGSKASPRFLAIGKQSNEAFTGELISIKNNKYSSSKLKPSVYYWLADAIYKATRASERALWEATAGHENSLTEQEAFEQFKMNIGLNRPNGTEGFRDAVNFARIHGLHEILHELGKNELVEVLANERLNKLEKDDPELALDFLTEGTFRWISFINWSDDLQNRFCTFVESLIKESLNLGQEAVTSTYEIKNEIIKPYLAKMRNENRKFAAKFENTMLGIQKNLKVNLLD